MMGTGPDLRTLSDSFSAREGGTVGRSKGHNYRTEVILNVMGQQYKQRRTILDLYLRWRSERRRKHRLRYPSPAEVRFVRIMGGRSLTVPFIRSVKTGFPLTFVWLGRVLKRELIERE